MVPLIIQNPPEINISFDKRRILVRLGAGKSLRRKDSAAGLKALIGEESERALNWLRPSVLAALLDPGELPDHPVFRNAEKVAFCICTIGPGLEQKCADLMSQGDMLRALVLDCLGSEAVSCTIKQACSWLSREGRALELRSSKPFAPGFKGWGIEGQSLIFKVLPAADIGVILTESFMMIPRKSSSFRINYFRSKR